MSKCPICGKSYIKSKPTRFGGMEYIHEIATTFTLSCQQSSASYNAAQQSVQADEVPRCTCKAGTGGHASWCELEKYWAALRR